ncbi:MAG: hypothetical protein II829_03150 [Bacteroidales bacterium]|nr:hypothetical protein [Bacteroidales bacterium]MBQ4398567.1 hypothetical protein [Bacteroidales bacterium]
MMKTNLTYSEQYLSIVKSADILMTSPAYVKAETKQRIEDVERFSRHLSKHLPELESYPSLMGSVFSLIDRDDMIGYLGEFLIDEAVKNCSEFVQIEKELTTKMDRIGNSSLTVDRNLLAEMSNKVKSWRRSVTLDNMDAFRRFLEHQRQQVDALYETLSDKEKLGQALAQSEEERRKLLEMEEARRRGITEMELDKEEKRRRAREEYAKNMKMRKKK